MPANKGQLISKCPFGAFKSTKKTYEIFVRISALKKKALISFKLFKHYSIRGFFWFNLFLGKKVQFSTENGDLLSFEATNLHFQY